MVPKIKRFREWLLAEMAKPICDGRGRGIAIAAE
jgi:hypothetical protein